MSIQKESSTLSRVDWFEHEILISGCMWERERERERERAREIIKSGSLWLAWVRAAGPEAAPGAVALQLVWVARAAKGRDIELVAMATQRRERRPQPSGHLLQFILSIERMVPAARYLICIYTRTARLVSKCSMPAPGAPKASASPPPSTCRRSTRSKSFFLINSALSNFDAHGTEYSDANFLRSRQMSFAPGRVVLLSRLHIATKCDWGDV